jgi:hypothetical protein
MSTFPSQVPPIPFAQSTTRGQERRHRRNQTVSAQEQSRAAPTSNHGRRGPHADGSLSCSINCAAIEWRTEQGPHRCGPCLSLDDPGTVSRLPLKSGDKILLDLACLRRAPTRAGRGAGSAASERAAFPIMGVLACDACANDSHRRDVADSRRQRAARTAVPNTDTWPFRTTRPAILLGFVGVRLQQTTRSVPATDRIVGLLGLCQTHLMASSLGRRLRVPLH